MRDGQTILIVDNDGDVADSLTVELRRLGYTVLRTNKPLKALKAFQSDPTAWHAVVSDDLMPPMRGLELLRRMKRIRPDLKTVLCTDNRDILKTEPAARKAADATCVKPIDAKEIGFLLKVLFQTP